MSAPLLVLHGVRKAYTLGAARVVALAGVDLTLRHGEIAAVTGPSGSGKSTLLNLCGLLDQGDSGQLFYDGKELPADEPQRTGLRRHRIGFVFQSFNLVPVMSAFDNVDYPLFLLGVPAPERRRRVMAVLARVGLDGLGGHRPDQLSGGQRQRVAIARAVVKEPQLVIADEPTANLDSVTAAHIVELMKALSHEHGTTFLVATHDHRLLDHCDRALMLSDGHLSAGCGTDIHRTGASHVA